MPRRRLSFATVAVTGLGAFVAAAVGVTLYVSAATGWRSTQALIGQQTEALLDALEQRLAARLRPIDEQADWIAEAVNNGRIDLARPGELDRFMFGALGVTPQVSDIGIVDAAGRAQRWRRGELRALRDDWSSRPEIREWLAAGQIQPGRAWRPLLWKPAERAPSLLHQVPLHRAGQFVGMLGQVVPIAKVSEDLAVFRAEYEVTPFMLDDNDRVLGHPTLAQRRADAPGAFATLAELGDPVLERLRSPDGAAPLLAGLKQARAVRARVPETIARLSEHPNIIGVKDSSNDVAGFAATVRVCPSDFAVLTGNGAVLLDALRAGATGAILAVGCVAPEICVQLFNGIRPSILLSLWEMA
jgi:hypothetical protein